MNKKQLDEVFEKINNLDVDDRSDSRAIKKLAIHGFALLEDLCLRDVVDHKEIEFALNDLVDNVERLTKK